MPKVMAFIDRTCENTEVQSTEVVMDGFSAICVL